MIHLLYAGATSACFELKSETAYYAPAVYEVELCGERRFVCDANVFSLFSLTPGTAYTLRVKAGDEEETLNFRTVQAAKNPQRPSTDDMIKSHGEKPILSFIYTAF